MDLAPGVARGLKNDPVRTLMVEIRALGNRVVWICGRCEGDFHPRGNTTMAFRILGLPAEDFAHLFELSDPDLRAQGGVRRTVDGNYPCRVSLTDSEPGEELLLVNYEHHRVDSPYRMRFAVFVREGDETYNRVNEVPEQLRRRTLAVRSFDRNEIMIDNQLVDGRELERPYPLCGIWLLRCKSGRP